MRCLFQEANVIDDNGEVHYEKIIRLIPDHVMDYVQHIIDNCVAHVPEGETKCDRAWSLNVCWKTTDPVVSKLARASKHFFKLINKMHFSFLFAFISALLFGLIKYFF